MSLPPCPVLIWNALKLLLPGRKGGRNTKSGSDEAKWAVDPLPRVAILATLFLYDYARNRWAKFPFNGRHGVGTYLLHTTGAVKLESIPCTEKNFNARYGALENDGSIARSLPSFARLVQGNANFSSFIFSFSFGEVIGEGILLTLGYVEYVLSFFWKNSFFFFFF